MGDAVKICDDLLSFLIALPSVKLLDVGEYSEELLLPVVLKQPELNLGLGVHNGFSV